MVRRVAHRQAGARGIGVTVHRLMRGTYDVVECDVPVAEPIHRFAQESAGAGRVQHHAHHRDLLVAVDHEAARELPAVDEACAALAASAAGQSPSRSSMVR